MQFGIAEKQATLIYRRPGRKGIVVQNIIKGNPPWVGAYRCTFCLSTFELTIEDGGSIYSFEPYPYTDTVKRVELGRCPVCHQRGHGISPWFDRIGDAA